MPFPPFHYSKNWTDPADFPTHESSEAQNRADLQRAYTEWETYWNNVFLPELQSAIAPGSGSGDSDDGGPYLALSGGILRGPLRLARAPQMTDEAATKAYVDSAAQHVATNSTGNIAALNLRADQIEALAQNNQGDIAALSVRADEIAASVSGAIGEQAVLDILKDRISLTVSEPVTDGETVYSNITLRVGPHSYTGQILMTGDVDVSGQLSADALYAAYGSVADLVVDKFSTSKRIKKYLAGDTSDDNFIRAQDESIEWIAGIYNGGVEQARSPTGALLFWEDNPDAAGTTFDPDGYKRGAQGNRIHTTLIQTEWPVYVYTYTEQVKGRIAFQNVGSDSGGNPVYMPVFSIGAGNVQGYNTGTIAKGPDGLKITYVTPDGKSSSIHMKTDATIAITGFETQSGDSPAGKRPLLLDFSAWDNGFFSELQEGDAAAQVYTVSFDLNGRPSLVTDASGFSTAIQW